MKEKIKVVGTMVIRHLDKDGNVKPVFQENKLGAWLLRKGWISPKLHIPYLLGKWQDYKEIELWQ